MATFDKLIEEIGSRFCLGPKASLLVREILDLISGQPGGIDGFLNRIQGRRVRRRGCFLARRS